MYNNNNIIIIIIIIHDSVYGAVVTVIASICPIHIMTAEQRQANWPKLLVGLYIYYYSFLLLGMKADYYNFVLITQRESWYL